MVFFGLKWVLWTAEWWIKGIVGAFGRQMLCAAVSEEGYKDVGMQLSQGLFSQFLLPCPCKYEHELTVFRETWSKESPRVGISSAVLIDRHKKYLKYIWKRNYLAFKNELVHRIYIELKYTSKLVSVYKQMKLLDNPWDLRPASMFLSSPPSLRI